jgi:hypothetical protein
MRSGREHHLRVASAIVPAVSREPERESRNAFTAWRRLPWPIDADRIARQQGEEIR